MSRGGRTLRSALAAALVAALPDATLADKLDKVRRADFIPPRELRPDLPDDLERILMKLLAIRVEERYQ